MRHTFLVIVMLVALVAYAEENTRYRALIIANNVYKDPTGAWSSLNGPKNDARKLREVLEKYYGFRDTIYLEDAKRRDILKALRTIIKETREDDNILIFYAGHGHFDEIIEDGYWVPVDAEGEGEAKLISNLVVRDRIATLSKRCKHVVMISDSCFSGDLLSRAKRSLKIVGRGERSDYYRKKSQAKSCQVITSGGKEYVDDDFRNTGHSPFAYFLLDKLQNNNEQYLSFSELGVHLEKVVTNAAHQTPEYGTLRESLDAGGEFFFVRKRKSNHNDKIADFSLSVVVVNKDKKPMKKFSPTDGVYVQIRGTVRNTAGEKYAYLSVNGKGIKKIRKRFAKVSKGKFRFHFPLRRTQQQGRFLIEIELRIGGQTDRQSVKFDVVEKSAPAPRIGDRQTVEFDVVEKGGEFDLSALRAKAKREQLAWQKYQKEMKRAYDEMLKLGREFLPGEDKAKAWRQFAMVYGKDNPHSGDDDAMRTHATAHAKYWDTVNKNAGKIRETSADDRYQVSYEGVIYDTKTKLEWYVLDKTMNHYDAEKYAKNLTVAGGGWRLPSIEELRGIYKKGSGSDNIDPVFKTSSRWLWVWSQEIHTSSSARGFLFDNGTDLSCDRDDVNTFGSRVFVARSGRR